MRLFNYTFVAGSKTISELENTLPSSNLVTSGVVEPGNSQLDKKAGGAIGMFATPFGNDDTESPYGNSRLYNVGRVNTTLETSLSQSFSAPMTGSAHADFVFIIESNYRG